MNELKQTKTEEMSWTPQNEISQSKEMANDLMSVVEEKKLYVQIKNRKYLRVEAWQLLGRFCRLWGRITESKPVELWDHRGFESTAEIINEAGEVISSAAAVCMDDEDNWMNKPIFELKSMSQTRALSKAFRIALGFIVSLAGYETTPSEEMQSHQANASSQSVPASSSKPNKNEKKLTESQKKDILAYIEDDEVRNKECRNYLQHVGKSYIENLTETEADILLSRWIR